MKKTAVFLVYLFCLIQYNRAEEYQPLELSGFNADVIYTTVESAGNHTGIDHSGWSFYSKEMKESGGLPQSFISRSGVPYQLADFKSDNALRIFNSENDQSKSGGELSLVSPVRTKELWVLGLSASGEKELSFVVNYTDGTSSTVLKDYFPDWYQSSSDQSSYYGLDRIEFQSGNYDGRLNFGLFEKIILVDPSKMVKSVRFSFVEEGTSYVSIFALTAYDGVSRKDEKTLYLISNSHLDTQWNWTVRTTIDQYIKNTMQENFSLFENFPGFHFNFEGAIKYRWMEEYYPEGFAKLKNYVDQGRWSLSGASIDANDVMVPSAESFIRNFLYGQEYYKKTFGRNGGTDVMLPDCFGFPYSLPTLATHCGLTGFHTAKLAWGASAGYDNLPPFARWRGVDGSEIFALLKPGAYDHTDSFEKDLTYDSDILNTINSNEENYQVPAAFRYTGRRGDRGGGVSSEFAQWLETSVNGNGPVTVRLVPPDTVFNVMDRYRSFIPVWDDELPMKTHGVGCYTSQAILKYWNRKNELLADATEKTSVVSDWLGGLDYPGGLICESWIRFLWHQFHDDLTGTSIPMAYTYTCNDHVLAQLDLSKTLVNSVGAVAGKISTDHVRGIPVMVYNPLSIERTDVVEATLELTPEPETLCVVDKEGALVPVQKLKYEDGRLTFVFVPTVPALGYACYDVRPGEAGEEPVLAPLSVTSNTLENEEYRLTIDQNGDVSSIVDKKQENKELLGAPIRLAMLWDESLTWPSWEIHYDQLQKAPRSYAGERGDVVVSVEERGPVRATLKITRTGGTETETLYTNGEESGISSFTQYISLYAAGSPDRIDFYNEVNWQSKLRLLKAVFPLNTSNPEATYDMSIGTIRRPVSKNDKYEFAGHQWADQTRFDNSYGMSILNDCKYGWDKPDNRTLRLSLIHTPRTSNNYVYQANQDLGFNSFTFAFYRHIGRWNEKTQWEAAKLNQPMFVFKTDKHQGELGASFGFASLNTDKVAIKALKKAEASDDMVVRVYELTGESHEKVEISFPSTIVSASEVNGVEERVGEASFEGNTLTFGLTGYQPKSFAVRLSPSGISAEKPSSLPITLPYNIDVMSYDSNKTDGRFGRFHYAYPAELIDDRIVADGIAFTMGDRRDGMNNAVQCMGQTISMPENPETKKVYILAASQHVNGTDARFEIDGESHGLKIAYFGDYVGQWSTAYADGFYRSENVAFTATHRHNVISNDNMAYHYLYMFKYAIPVNGEVRSVTLPDDPDVIVFAISLSDNKNDNLLPLKEVCSLPVPKIEEDVDEVCGDLLSPETITALSEVNAEEAARMAADQNPFTKWCCTTSENKWIAYEFGQELSVCGWEVLHAEVESKSFITSDFQLEYDSEGKWMLADKVVGNTENKTRRELSAPVRTSKVRLFITREEQKQSRGAARIYEFKLFGNSSTDIPNVESGQGLRVEVYPNPFQYQTTFRCFSPEEVDEIELTVYNTAGVLTDKRVYSSLSGNEHQLVWQDKGIAEGLYLYKLVLKRKNTILCDYAGKMVCVR